MSARWGSCQQCMNEVSEHYEVECKHPYVPDEGPWQNLGHTIHGADRFPTLADADKMLDESMPAIQKHDPFYRGLTFRIVKVTREVVR